MTRRDQKDVFPETFFAHVIYDQGDRKKNKNKYGICDRHIDLSSFRMKYRVPPKLRTMILGQRFGPMEILELDISIAILSILSLMGFSQLIIS